MALVIGNAKYQHAPALANPANDADAIAAALRNAGFKVDERKNLDADGMRGAILAFGERAETADVAVVYYAGHGIQADGINYLIPVDAALRGAGSLQLEAIPADSILGAVVLAHHLRLLILDACRDNPFKASLMTRGARGIGNRGLAAIAPQDVSDTVIAYSAKENTEALDGSGANSPFAAALAHRLDEPGVELSKVLREVRSDVIAGTGGRQEPGFYDSRGIADFYFMPGGTVVNNTNVVVRSPTPVPATSVAMQPPPVQTTEPGMDPQVVEMHVWDSVKDSKDPDVLQSYLDQYPQGSYARVARAKIAALERARPSTTLTTSTAPPFATLPPEAQQDLCHLVPGAWKWFNAITPVKLSESGEASTFGGSGHWTCSGNHVEIRWTILITHNVDELTISPDGKRLDGHNDDGQQVWGTRL